MGNHSDGELSESGFTSFGSNYTTGAEWENRLEHMRHLQRNGKFWLDVSYWGPKNVRTHANVSADFTGPIDYLIGSWLLGNEGLSAVFMGPNDCAPPCIFDGWKHNMLNYSQFTAQVGEPLGSACKGTVPSALSATPEPGSPQCAGVWSRNFSKALVFVNPQPEGPPCVLRLDPGEYTRLDGTHFDNKGDQAVLAAPSALVLLRTAMEAQ